LRRVLKCYIINITTKITGLGNNSFPQVEVPRNLAKELSDIADFEFSLVPFLNEAKHLLVLIVPFY
jgi:hypothetical protein